MHREPTTYEDGRPPSWDADVLLKDGRVAQLRPITPEDTDAFVAFYSRVSDESKYYRFFAPYPTLSARDVERFTHVDLDRRVAFVLTLHDDIIGVGRYDATSDDEAEVAFLVEDAHQGRGVGQLLLEHLAQAGRERGIKRFTADVLPSNNRMLQVFREMGYSVEGVVEDGVQQLSFRIDPTDSAVGVMRSREQRAEAASIERIFAARSIAVVGASRRQRSIGQTIVRNLVLGDYQGSVYAVNSQAEAVSGLPAFKSVKDIPHEVDLAIVAVPAESVNDVVLAVITGGIRGWMLTRAEPVTAKTSFRAMVPMSVAADDGLPTSLGSKVRGHLLSLPVGETNPVVRLHQVSYALKDHRETGSAVAANQLASLPGFATSTFHAVGARVAATETSRGHHLTITNVPGPQEPVYMAGEQVAEVYPAIPLIDQRVVSIGVTSYHGGVFFGIVADREAVPDVDVLGQCIEEALEELVETVGPRRGRAPRGRQKPRKA